MKRRYSPHRFGRHTRIDEHAREVGEPSLRVRERTARGASAAVDAPQPAHAPSLPSPPSGKNVSASSSFSRQPARSKADESLGPEWTCDEVHESGKESACGKENENRGNENGYAELHCLSNFSFQRGASSAGELFERAAKLGYAALAITDECSLAGIVRAFEAAKESGLKLIVGTEVHLADGPKLVVLAADHAGYTDICRLITTGRRRSAKGEYRLTRADAERLGAGVCVLWVPEPGFAIRDAVCGESGSDPQSETPSPGSSPDSESPSANPGSSNPESRTPHPGSHAKWLMQHFAGRAWLAVELHRGPDDAAELARLRALGARHGLPLVAAGDVHMHVRRRRALHDVMTAIRLRCTVAEAGHALFPNGERHLRRREDLASIYPADLRAETLRIAARCTFRLDGLDYRYPKELVPPQFDADANAYLRKLTYDGAARLWPGGIPAMVRAQVERELALIADCRFEHFFLTVEDIVRWARTRQPPILCQGRGSSANSAVCYCLGITSVNPETGNLLFERFLSKERDEPPDIDVDFEHERREEVLQYVFDKYGRERAALAATVISYRRKSAVRDVGRALGLTDDALDQLTAISSRVPSGQTVAQAMRARGFDPDSRVLLQLVRLTNELHGFPRHLSQHVGGFVISDRPLHHLVPVENAAMADRTIIQWDKDDLETMKLLKVDCLALGMLTCLRKCIDLLHAHGLWTLPYTGAAPSLHDIPQRDDPAVYDMICAADTVGVFQIESRAQMSMLPRLKPREFYDLVIEVAIVRPGPIQGNMVHPYLRRRNGEEPIDYPCSAFERESGAQSKVREVLGRTLGVPIFQEQVMKLIQVVAGFTPGEADQLRRAMAAWKRRGGLERFHDRIRDGMLERGYGEDYFERIFEQIKGFGDYGFPESHAASFALLAWASCWLKHYHPAAFTCALLNAQPMGFYQPSQLIQDAQRHGVRVLPVDVTISDWDCTLEEIRPPQADDQCPSPGQRLLKRSPPSSLGGEGWVRGQRVGLLEPSRNASLSDPHDPQKPDYADASFSEFNGSANFSAAPSPQPSPPTMKPSGERESDATARSPTMKSPQKKERAPAQALDSQPRFALRLGLRQVRGLSEALAKRIVAARSARPFRDVADLVERAQIDAGGRACLADAGALRGLSGHRHRARWDSAGAEVPLPVLAGAAPHEARAAVRPPSLREDVVNDYATLGLSLTLHPLALIRPALARRRVATARAIMQPENHGRRLRHAGLVTVRQHPGTAKGVTFVTLEDETGFVNVVVWRALAERQHRELLESAVLCVDGRFESHDGVHHLIAERLHDYSGLLPDLTFASRDFH